MRFQVTVNMGSQVVRTETIATMQELKSFAYGIMLSPATAHVYDNLTGAMLFINENGPSKYCTAIYADEKFLRKFKKSEYATL